MSPRRSLLVALASATAGCSTLTYDLGEVPFEVSARPAPAAAVTEPFAASGKSVLWVHGLLGRDQADVAALLRESCGRCTGVADFRAEATTSFHDWLVTHLTLGLVRIRTVTVRGERIVR